MKTTSLTRVLFTLSLAFVLVASGLAADRHDCSHEFDSQHHDCALCWLSFSLAEDSPSVSAFIVEAVTLTDFVPTYLFSGLTLSSSRDSRAPPLQ